MTWMILNTEPAYGVCDQCKQHTCGIVDGQHRWVQTGVYDRSGDAIVIGYKCVELWANNLGISLQVIEKEKPTPPTDEQISEFVRNALLGPHTAGPSYTHSFKVETLTGDQLIQEIEKMTREELKIWLTSNDIPFAKNLSDDKLRELVTEHS